MLEQKNTIFWFKLNGISRYILTHIATKFFPLYIVNEYPKSGGSWVSSMLSDALNIPFPRNRLPMLRSSILHGHMMHSWNVKNMVVVWRDGRDVLISLYYHSLFDNELSNSYGVKKCRSDLKFDNYEDIRANLPKFIDYVFYQKKISKMTWSDFVNKWAYRKDVAHVRYESLLKNPNKTLKGIIAKLSDISLSDKDIELIIQEHSFQNKSGRLSGCENKNSFLRKGISGDWKNHFNKESREKFNALSGKELIILGYEENEDWVNDPRLHM
jgi:hypothetical protein